VKPGFCGPDIMDKRLLNGLLLIMVR